MTEPLLLSIRDAARRLGVGRDHAYMLVREGRLRSIAVGSRRLVPVAELAEFVRREVTEPVGNGSGVESGPRRVETRA